MNVFYTIIRILTLPGSAMRFALEQLVMRSDRIPVTKTEFFNSEATSHVEHECPSLINKAYDVASAAFTTNLLLGIIASVTGMGLFFMAGVRTWWALLVLWLGFSMLCNLFPTRVDAANLVYRLSSEKKRRPIMRPMAKVFRFGAKLEETGLILITSTVFECVLCCLVTLAALILA
ncbi:MAG: hypothetical protein K6C36_00875 [Clostridia bacterium]|nr:hypothetical protein [Clostridia bacterium]